MNESVLLHIFVSVFLFEKHSSKFRFHSSLLHWLFLGSSRNLPPRGKKIAWRAQRASAKVRPLQGPLPWTVFIVLILKWKFLIHSLAPSKKCPFRRWPLWCTFQRSKRNKNFDRLAEEFWRKLKATNLQKIENQLVWSERNPRSDRWLLNKTHHIQAIELYSCKNIKNCANSSFTITAEIHARSLAKCYGQYEDRHMNLKFVRRVTEREREIRQSVIVKNKLMTVFNASVLLLKMNFVITLSK